MTTFTTNLSLVLITESNADLNLLFSQIRDYLNGTSGTSNMSKIDTNLKNSDRMNYSFQDSTDFIGTVVNSDPATGKIQFGCAALDGSGDIDVTYPVAYTPGSFPSVFVWVESPTGTAANEIYSAQLVGPATETGFSVIIRKTVFTPASISESSPTFSISVEEANVLPNPRNFYLNWMAISA